MYSLYIYVVPKLHFVSKL